MDETTPTPIAEQPSPQVLKKRSMLPFVLIGGFVVLILFAIIGIVVGLSILRSPQTTTPQETPTPTPVPTVIEIITNQNPKYASDSALINLRDQLRNLSAEIGGANFFEPEISAPNIDLNLEIK